jgi:hypothetical protein
VTWDTAAPDATSRSRGAGLLPPTSVALRIVGGGRYYVSYSRLEPPPSRATSAWLARLDPSTSAITEIGVRIPSVSATRIYADERSTRVVVETARESHFGSLLVETATGMARDAPSCFGARGDRIAWWASPDSRLGLQVEDGALETAVLPVSPGDRPAGVGLQDEGIFWRHVVSGTEIVLYARWGETTHVVSRRMPPEHLDDPYFGAPLRGVAVNTRGADGLISVHDRALDRWRAIRMPGVPRAISSSFLDHEAQVVENDSAFFATTGTEIWVIPKRP